MRIVFIGNIADYSPGFLEALTRRSVDPADDVSVVAVICPAARRGRAESLAFTAKRRIGGRLDRLPDRRLPPRLRSKVTEGGGVHRRLQRLAHRCGAPILWPRKLDEVDAGAIDADIGIVAGLDRILREPLISALPPLYNVHPSMLPEFRGPTPEFWQLDGGLDRSGVTIHRIDPGVDTGPIVMQRDFPIDPWLDADGLTARGVEVGIGLVDELLAAYPECDATAREQSGGSHQPVPDPDLALVPFERTAVRAYDRARAFGLRHPLHVHVAGWPTENPTPAVPESASTTRLELYDPVPHADATGVPGLVATTPGGGAVVWCATGALEFRRAEVSERQG